MKLNGSQTLARLLKAHGVEYVAGTVGFGSLCIVDALQSAPQPIPFIQVMQEQSAVYMADGYFRACGRPMAAIVPTAIGVSKVVSGLACANAQASSVLVISGGEPSYIPEPGRAPQKRIVGGDCDASNVTAEYVAEHPDELPAIVRTAFATMVRSAPGPVVLTLPVAVQVKSHVIKSVPAHVRVSVDVQAAQAEHIALAAQELAWASRPVIVAGGGVMASDACNELLEVAEGFCCPVLTNAEGKGAIAEDHPLAGGSLGRLGSACANRMLADADLILVVGSRIEEVQGTAPIILIEADPGQGDSHHQFQLGIKADIRSALSDLATALSASQAPTIAADRSDYLKHLYTLRDAWEARLDVERSDESSPFMIQKPLAQLRAVLERDAVVVVGAGRVRGAVQQMFPVYGARTHLSSSRFGALGWAVPAAIGAKLALPARQVVCVVGDGDFLQSMQEMAVCVMHSIPVLFMVFNNNGFMSLRDSQAQCPGQPNASEFNLPDGKPYSPAFTDIARSFGLESWRVEHHSQLGPALNKAINSTGPALIEVLISRQSNGAIDPYLEDVS